MSERYGAGLCHADATRQQAEWYPPPEFVRRDGIWRAVRPRSAYLGLGPRPISRAAEVERLWRRRDRDQRAAAFIVVRPRRADALALVPLADHPTVCPTLTPDYAC